MDNRFQEHDRFMFKGGCPCKTSEEVSVTVPVSVSAHADRGNVELRCMGPSVITRDCDRDPCSATHRFCITQRMRVDIPIKFEAQADIGKECVKFASCEKDDDDDEKCKCSCKN